MVFAILFGFIPSIGLLILFAREEFRAERHKKKQRSQKKEIFERNRKREREMFVRPTMLEIEDKKIGIILVCHAPFYIGLKFPWYQFFCRENRMNCAVLKRSNEIVMKFHLVNRLNLIRKLMPSQHIHGNANGKELKPVYRDSFGILLLVLSVSMSFGSVPNTRLLHQHDH